MIIKLPTIKRIWDETAQKIEVEKGELVVQIDTSFKAHLKWEEQFGAQMGCDLNGYIRRVQLWIKNENTAIANFLGMLKMLYCMINSDKLPTFGDFIELFDFEIAEEILKRIGTVLEESNKFVGKN